MEGSNGENIDILPKKIGSGTELPTEKILSEITHRIMWVISLVKCLLPRSFWRRMFSVENLITDGIPLVISISNLTLFLVTLVNYILFSHYYLGILQFFFYNITFFFNLKYYLYL